LDDAAREGHGLLDFVTRNRADILGIPHQREIRNGTADTSVVEMALSEH
jgi:hypothetical protein